MDWSPKMINNLVKTRTVSGVLSLVEKEGIQSFGRMNQNFVRSVLAIWLVQLNEFIYGNDKAKALTESQINHTVETLVEMPEFRNITIADMSLIFKKAYSGDFGVLYGRIRPDIVLGWFKTYFDERCDVAASQSQTNTQQAQVFTGATRNAESAKTIRETIRKGIAIGQARERQEKIKAKPEKPE